MVKRSLFWGQAAGKLGEAVYYRSGGEQRTRTYIKNIKNPRSQAQAISRAKLNNLTASFRGMSLFLRSFFKASKASQSAFNAFVSQNSALNPYVANESQVKSGLGWPLGMQVANGDSGHGFNITIKELAPTLDAESSGRFKWFLPLFVPDLKISAADQANTEVAIVDGKRLYQIFAAPENGLNLPAEFNLTFVWGSGGADGLGLFTFTVLCSATSNDVLHVVQTPPDQALPADYANSMIRLAGGKADAKPPLSSVTGAIGLTFGMGSLTKEELSEAFALVISYMGANGKTWNTALLQASEALKQEAEPWRVTGEVGSTIVAGYTGVQSTI